MKIVFYLGSMNKGGAERVVSNITDFLAKKNHDTYIITTSAGESMYVLNSNVTHLKLDHKGEKINGRIKRNKIRIERLNKYLEQIAPDVIISFLPEPTFKLMHLRDKIKAPIIISDRNDPKIEYRNPVYYYNMKKYYKKADGFVFQTEEAKGYFSKEIRKKSIVISNPINSKFVNVKGRNHEIVEKTIITVGRLTEQKNQKLLIEAFKDVQKKYPEYSVKIFGDGHLRESLNKTIEKNGLKGSVFLMGETENIIDELQKAYMFVMTSNYEGMPNALMEAMAVGVPVISTNCPCGGPKCLINNNENGILVHVNKKKELTNSMIKLIQNPDFANNMGENARKIVNRVNPEKIFDDWENYIIKQVKSYKEKNGLDF